MGGSVKGRGSRLIDFIDDVAWPFLNLGINPGQVFPHQPQQDELNSEEHEDNGDKGRQSGTAPGSVEKAVNQEKDAQSYSKGGKQKTRVTDQPNGIIRKADHDV